MTMGFLAALFLVLAYAPIQRYRPSCGGTKIRHYFDGPMREVFIDMMTEAMAEDDFPYIRVGKEIFIRLYDFDDFILNSEWKISESIGLGYGPGSRRIPAPPTLLLLMKKSQEIIELDQSLSEFEKKKKMDFLFRDDCELIRAAAIRIEDMAPEDLLRYIPKSPLPLECTPRNMRGWRRQCGVVVRGDTVITPAYR